MKTLAQLRKLSDEQLQAYFGRYARYNPQSPVDSQYFIRPGTSSCLFSHDTKELRDKFFNAVKGQNEPAQATQ